MGQDPRAEQRLLITQALEVVACDHFALAGSGAIREHGLTDRPTNDIDLFTVAAALERFPQAVRNLVAHLEDNGYAVNMRRETPGFTQLSVTTPSGTVIDIDLGVDWRAHTPTRLAIGPVLDREDAVANKLAALYSRGLPRDYLDVDSIRLSGAYTDENLIELLASRDSGYNCEYFTECLRMASRITLPEVRAYGIDATRLKAVQARFTQWAHHLEHAAAPESTHEILPAVPQSEHDQ